MLAEQGLIEALTEHAQKIAANVLNQGDAGVNLADDIKVNDRISSELLGFCNFSFRNICI